MPFRLIKSIYNGFYGNPFHQIDAQLTQESEMRRAQEIPLEMESIQRKLTIRQLEQDREALELEMDLAQQDRLNCIRAKYGQDSSTTSSHTTTDSSEETWLQRRDRRRAETEVEVTEIMKSIQR